MLRAKEDSLQRLPFEIEFKRADVLRTNRRRALLNKDICGRVASKETRFSSEETNMKNLKKRLNLIAMVAIALTVLGSGFLASSRAAERGRSEKLAAMLNAAASSDEARDAIETIRQHAGEAALNGERAAQTSAQT